MSRALIGLAAIILLCPISACAPPESGQPNSLQAPADADHSARSRLIVLDPNPVHTPLPDSRLETSPHFPPRFNIRVRDIRRDEMCAQMWQGDFWEPGIQAQSLMNHLHDNTHVVVDDQPLSDRKGYMFFSWDYYDADGTNTGSYGGNYSYYFTTEGLDIGTHKATISVNSISGVRYPYSWSFEIQENS